MSKLPLDLSPGRAFSKIDRTDWTRETFRAAYGMARRMIHDRATHGTGAAWTWFLQHARRRFTTPAAWRIAQAAGRLVFDARTVGYAAAGSVADLERQGLVRATAKPRRGNLVGMVAYRGVTLERVRSCGLNLLWTHDPLASSSNQGRRVYRAQQRREVARILAADRLTLAETRFALTPAGRAALAAAEVRSAAFV